MKINIISLDIIFRLVSIFMIAGLYAWFVFGVQVDQEHRAAEHNNITRIVSKQLEQTKDIIENNKKMLGDNKVMLNAIYSNVKAAQSSQKNLNLTLINHDILSDTNHIVHNLLGNLTAVNANKQNKTKP